MSLNRSLILTMSLFGGFALAATSASAAIFDSIDSVETIQKVAAQNKKSDRLPASEAAEQNSLKDSKDVTTPSETKNTEKN